MEAGAQNNACHAESGDGCWTRKGIYLLQQIFVKIRELAQSAPMDFAGVLEGFTLVCSRVCSSALPCSINSAG
jgi:hypothetical protein